MSEPVGVTFVHPMNPTEAELRAWAYSRAGEPVDDWNLALYDYEPRLQPRQAYGTSQAIGHEWTEGVHRADLVLEQALNQGALELGRELGTSVRVGSAKNVFAPVRPGEAERPGTLAAGPLEWPEPAGEPSQVEDRHANRGTPESAEYSELRVSAGGVQKRA